MQVTRRILRKVLHPTAHHVFILLEVPFCSVFPFSRLVVNATWIDVWQVPFQFHEVLY
jgi:hypothetical protein